jgi:hypothetical protein
MKRKLYITVILSGILLTAATRGLAQPERMGTSDLYWELVSNKLTITGTGAMPDYITNNQLPWYHNHVNIRTIELPPGLTTIGNYAFLGCANLASVSIPEGVTTIGGRAFYNCPNLASVHISEGVTMTIGNEAFSRCKSLASIHIPEGVTAIGNEAFIYCTSLAAVDIPASVTTFGGNVFDGCTSLASVIMAEGLTTIGYRAFYNCTSLAAVDIPASVTTIEDQAFYTPSLETIHVDEANLNYASVDGVLYDKNKTTILFCPRAKTGTLTVPAGVTTIGYRAFDHCTRLAAVDIPASLTTIGIQAFDGCTSLAAVNMAEGVTTIGDAAFSGCTSLASVDIPASVTTIGDGAFYGCESLDAVDIPASVTTIGNLAFYTPSLETIHVDEANLNYASVNGVLYDKNKTTLLFCPQAKTGTLTVPEGVTTIETDAFSGCASLAVVDIPASVTTIGERAFSGCTSLAAVHIPEGVTTIGTRAFYNCTSLAAVDIPAGVATIGEEVFRDCWSLAAVDIPEGVTTIGTLAFYNCTSLAAVDIPASVTTIGYGTFYNCTSLDEIVVRWPNPAAVSFGTDVFYNVSPGCKLYAVEGTGDYLSAIFTGMDIEEVFYAITATASAGGTVTASSTFALAGTPVTLTLAPARGYEVDTVSAFRTVDSQTSVALSGTGLSRTFTMPAYGVTVSALFRILPLELPPVITGAVLLPDTAADGHPVFYTLEPYSRPYALLEGNLLIPLRNGEVRITASGVSLPAVTFTVEIAPSPSQPAAIRRAVILPAVPGAVTDPPAGTHHIESGSSFVFTLTPAPGNAFSSAPVIRTGRPSEPDAVVTALGDGSYTVRIPAVRQTLQLSIDAPVTAGAGTVHTAASPAGDRIWSSGGQLHISAALPGEAHVYTLTGARLKTLRYAAGETVTPLPPGCYLIQTGTKTRKIMVSD